MKKVICIGLAIIFTMAIILGSNFDLYKYIQNVGENIPSFSAIFNDISNSISILKDADLNGFQAVIEWLRLMWQFLILPIKAIAYLFELLNVLSPMQFI